MPQHTEDFDVIVVGGGTAAFEASVCARQQGARVLLLEKAPEPDYGGNARFSSGAGFTFVHSGLDELLGFLPAEERVALRDLVRPPYTPEMFMKDLNFAQNGRVYPELANALVNGSNAALHWMHETGQKFAITPSTAALESLGGGLGQITRWREIAKRDGVEVRFDSPVKALHGNHRHIEGVRVAGPEGDYDARALSVILCSGGFQASAEHRARYVGHDAGMYKIMGSRYDTGEVLFMALAMGAAAAGDWQRVDTSALTPTPLTPGSVDIIYRRDFRFGITVNRRAERFMDEGPKSLVDVAEGTRFATSAVQMRLAWPEQVVSQPGGIVYQIFDQQNLAHLDKFYADGLTAEAPTIRELAQKIGLDPAALEATVTSYNHAIQDDVAYDPSRADGRGTRGLTPEKTNWATRIDCGPFQAYATTFGVAMSLGGLAINSNAQVLSVQGNPIRGLYASGDVAGIFFYTHLSGSGQTRNVVFSGIAARHALANAA